MKSLSPNGDAILPYTSNVNFRIAIQQSIDEELSEKYDFVHVKISFCNCEEFVTDIG